VVLSDVTDGENEEDMSITEASSVSHNRILKGRLGT
jgi:hypothetical protein